MQKMRNLLHNKRGELYIRACVVIIVILTIAVLLLNFVMVMAQAQGQRNGAIQSLDEYTQINAIAIYDSIKMENDKTESLDPDIFVAALCTSQGLQEESGTYVSYSASGAKQYAVSDVRMSYVVDKTTKIKVSYTLTVPLKYMGRTIWVDVPVNITTSFNPKFEATGASYTVNHWKENMDGVTYSLDKSLTLYCEPNNYVTPPVKNYEGFNSPALQTVVIADDQSTVVNYYYTRIKYYVTIEKDAGIESVYGAGRYFYGDTVTVYASTSSGYLWNGWIDDQDVLPDKKAIMNTFEIRKDVHLIATTRDGATDKPVHTTTLDYHLDQGINKGTYYDSGYKMNWDKDFEITTTINIPARGQRYLVVGNYDASSYSALNIEITAGDQVRVYLGTSGVHDKRYGVIPAGEEVTITFTWDASENTYTITGHSATVDFSGSGTYDMSGMADRSLRVGACDYRSGTQPFGDIYIGGFTTTQEVSEALAYGTLPTISRPGYTFAGWFDAEGNQITSDTVVTADRPHTLTARGTNATYKVTLDNQSATTAGTREYYYQYGTYYLTSQGGRGWMYADQALTQHLTTITPPTKTNEMFGGYYTGTDANGTLYIDGNGYFVDYGHCNVPSDVTLYADWIQKFTVTWANWDGTVLQTQQIFPGNMPAYTGPTPTRDPDVYNHYFFNGWSPTIQIVEANVIYTAQYRSEVHNWGTITYDWSANHEDCTASAICQTCTYYLVDHGTVSKTEYRAAHCLVNERWTHTAEFTYFPADNCDKWHYGQDALGHLMGEWQRNDEPCCETEGEDIRYCQRDNCTHSETRVVEATGHDWGEWVSTTSPTCTGTGIDTRTCQNTCDDGCCKRTETRVTDALGHLMGEWYVEVEPGCETDGYEQRDCQRSGCSYYQTYDLDALGHIWPQSWTRVTDPCCNTEGQDKRECQRNSSHKQYRDVAALGDRYGAWVTTSDPCCEMTGVKTRYCQNGVCTAACGCCDYTETDTISALGHNWSDWTVTTAPGCETEGVETRYCQNGCNHGCCEPETRSVAALGHKWSDSWTTTSFPCCNSTGTAIRRCQRDATHKETKTLSALGCDWGSWTTSWSPTCTNTGRKIRYCQNGCDPDECGCCDISQWENISALGHAYRWVVTTVASCGADGEQRYLCSRCNAEDPSTPCRYITDRPNHSNIRIITNPDPMYSQQKWLHYHACGVCNATFYCYGSCSYVSDDPEDW